MEVRTNPTLLKALKDSDVWRIFDREAARMSHAYLVLSEDKLALEQLLLLMCARAYCPTVCLSCAECRKVFGRNKVDVSEPNPEGETIKAEKAQDIVEDAMLGSLEGGKKIYVLRNMHLQTERVQNILLKTLEEPNANVLFLLSAEREKGVLPTILSRVKTLTLTPFSEEQTVAILEAEGIATSAVFAKAAMGNLTLACELGRDEDYFALVDEVVDVLAGLNRVAEVPFYLYRPIFAKDSLAKTLDVLELAVKDVMFVKEGVEEFVVYRDKLPVYRRIAPLYPVRSLPMILDVINESKLRVAAYCTAVNVADNLLLTMLEVKHQCAQS